MSHRFAALAALLAFSAASGAAQEAREQQGRDWDVTQARGQTREIDFTTTEGTWMSVDLSPDGRWLVFDLLGHIYRMPATGGEAECLTQNSGVAVNYQPRFSPDGKLIAFISDRKGQNNLWVMNGDGSDPRAVFTDLDVRASLPAWTPDGQYLIVRRDYAAPQAGDDAVEELGYQPLDPEQDGPQGRNGIWMYHKDGGQGVALVGTEVPGATWPSVSPDGRYVYFHTKRQQGEDALHGDYQIQHLDLQTGRRMDITSGSAEGPASNRASSGGAYAPAISPDGRWLAFARQIGEGTISFKGHRFGPRTALWVRDLQSGAERVLMDPISIAIESGSKSVGILPGYGWAADGKSIVISQGGKVRRLDVATGEVATIPFSARAHRTISEMAYRPFRISDGLFQTRFVRWPTLAPSGGTLAFQAVGRIWLMDRSSGTPRRLTPSSFAAQQEFAPAWSPDGQWIAFTTWDDGQGGHVWKMRARGGAPERLTTELGEYVHPAWSPDGLTLIVARGAGATLEKRTLTADPWWDIVKIPASGGQPDLVMRVALPAGSEPSTVARRAILKPSFGPGGRVFFPEFQRAERGLKTVLVSVRLDGSDRREHLALPAADELVPSPDGKWAAFEEGDNVYLTALPLMGTGAEPVDLNKRNGKLPVRQLSLEGGLFPHWRDSVTVEFGGGARHFIYHVDTRTADTTAIRLEIPRRIPQGTIALTGGRIVTLAGDQVIESGTVVINGSRITCVGTCPTEGTKVIDVRGKTLIPGFVDMHSHHYRQHRGYRPLHDYEVASYLAYGVTTSLDVSMWSQNIFPSAELIEAGAMVGPRTFSSGDPLYSGDAARQNLISSYQVAEQNINRLQSWGAVSMKQYLQPRRTQRQWISDVARQKGLMVTAEGGDLFYNLGMIMDGQTGWEHPISVVPLYGDVAKFFGRAKAAYSPTLVVAGPGPWNIEYFYAESDVWKDPKHSRWMPWRDLMGLLRRRTLRPETDYSFPLLAQGVADIIAQGGYGAMGSHGEHHALAPHWEIWMEASANGPLGALRIASLHGAHFLGVDQDLGSIEAGKLADILVLNANPLENIRNTLNLQYVMKGGVLYDATTLDEVWPTQRPFGPHYWVDDDALRNDDRPDDYWDRRGRR